MKRMRMISLLVLTLAAVVGTLYYWVSPTLGGLRPERVDLWQTASDWYQGVTGHMLSHHRFGLQITHFDPASGRVVDVWDLRWNAEQVTPERLTPPEGLWTILTVLEPWFSPAQLQLLEQAMAGSNLDLDWAAVNGGAGVFVVARDGAGLRLVAAEVSKAPGLVIQLPEGLAGPYGDSLSKPFTIAVQHY